MYPSRRSNNRPVACPNIVVAGCESAVHDSESVGHFVALVEVKALDRPRLLQDVTATLSDNHVNILNSQSNCGHDRVSKMRFEFELGDPSHLDTLLNRLRTIDSVYDAYRVVPGAVT